ncbi:MAG: hypothetical protein Q8N06_06840 [Hydrogenophaga sp.]|nr:hypothetical protein [Hydrogenophaga sp.]
MNTKFTSAAQAIAEHFKQAEAARGEPFRDTFINPMDNDAVTPNFVGIPVALLRTLVACDVRMFPIMSNGTPSMQIPWSVIAPFEHQAQRNHSQSLKRLAERGGLSHSEALAVLRGVRFDQVTERGADAVLALQSLVAERQQ